MKEFLIELFDYNKAMNDQFIEEKKDGPEESKRLFSHILNAHNIWNARIKEIGATLTPWEVHDTNAWHLMNEMNHRLTSEILMNRGLSEQLVYQNTKGVQFENKLSDILFHILNHGTHHRAQIMLALRQDGQDPLITDYIFYKRL